ncbi:hypothetical protein SAMN02745824_2633 [Parasphingorhabdus marina DSM 22363]|uniref:Uncharacterized protein n=1 Tax=Parasphingorhabdus marina DSM 22363 TaxID=1123272 RepID=A0A1N6G161_9SPHN|nr:hypothetical protein [Parasphingorhabdus marina]SIO01289.1 hypothetical protein SAMN02745824_2633 [Parasphingorhabdus marina DSM 22363]
MSDFLIVIAAIVSSIVFLLLVVRVFSWLAHRERKRAGHKYANRGSGGVGVGGYVAGGYGDAGGSDGGGGD